MLCKMSYKEKKKRCTFLAIQKLAKTKFEQKICQPLASNWSLSPNGASSTTTILSWLLQGNFSLSLQGSNPGSFSSRAENMKVSGKTRAPSLDANMPCTLYSTRPASSSGASGRLFLFASMMVSSFVYRSHSIRSNLQRGGGNTHGQWRAAALVQHQSAAAQVTGAAGSGSGAAANAAAPVQQLLTAAQVWSRW